MWRCARRLAGTPRFGIATSGGDTTASGVVDESAAGASATVGETAGTVRR